MTTLRSALAVVLALFFVLEGVAARTTWAAPPAAGASTTAETAPTTQTAEEGFPRWAKWTLAGAALAAGVALLFVFVIVPAVAEGTARGVAENCCNGGGGGSNGSDDGLL